MTIDGVPDRPESDVRRGSERRWVLTNRRNLIEFVSGMVIRPVEALTKYYTDPLELTPGAVPVLTTPAPDELVELAESSAPDICFPVLIELPEKHPKRVPAVCLTRPLVLHFRTEHERDEVLARSWDNADLTGTESHVSPHLFTGGRPFRSGTGLRRRKPMAAENYERLDRFLGALTVLGMACGADGQLGEAEQVFSRTTLLPGGAEWFPVLRDWLNDKPGDTSAESALFRSAVNVFGSSDPTRVMGRTEVLAAIREKTEPAGQSDGGENQNLDRQLDMVEAVFRGDREFDTFNDGGSTAVKAILFALLDQNPSQLCSEATRRNATDNVLAGAAALCGLLHGRRRISVGERDIHYDAFLADLETHLIIHRLTSPGSMARVRSAVVRLVASRKTAPRKPDGDEGTSDSQT